MKKKFNYELNILFIGRTIREQGFAIDEAVDHGNNLFVRICSPKAPDESLGVVSIPKSVFELDELSARREIKQIIKDTCKNSITYLKTGTHG